MSMNALMWAWTVIQNEMDLKIGARLVLLNLVERTPRKGGSGENRTNFYRLKISPNQGKHSLARGNKKTAVKGG